MGWLIAIGTTLYILYRFWKVILKWMLIVSVIMFMFLVVKIKNVYDDLTSKNTIEQTITTGINNKTIISEITECDSE